MKKFYRNFCHEMACPYRGNYGLVKNKLYYCKNNELEKYSLECIYITYDKKVVQEWTISQIFKILACRNKYLK